MVILPPYRGHTVYLAQDMPDPRACHMPTRDTLAAAPIDDFDDMPALVPIDDFDDMPTRTPCMNISHLQVMVRTLEQLLELRVLWQGAFLVVWQRLLGDVAQPLAALLVDCRARAREGGGRAARFSLP